MPSPSSQPEADLPKDVAAYIEAVGHMLTVEAGARFEGLGEMLAIRHPVPILHPTPREFHFSHEFLACSTAPETVAAQIRDQLPADDQEHVLTVLTPDPEATVAAYGAQGYELAWTNVLLGRDLDAPDTFPPAPEGLTVRPVADSADVDAVNDLDPLFPTAHWVVRDPLVRSLLAERGGQVVAKARLSLTGRGIVHITQMFTDPHCRRRGYARALLGRLHDEARALGMRRAVLLPSQVTRQIGFFEKLGYREVTPLVVLAPREEA